jgi:defect-in-organelle-trafficking protein DotD
VVKTPCRTDSCDTFNLTSNCPAPNDVTAYNTVEGQLLASARSIEQSLLTLAAAEEAENPPIIKTGPLVTPEAGMGGHVDIDWTGPIQPLLEKIACMTEYHFKVLGTEPPIPIIVSITAKRAVLADVLQNASFQTTKRAHILVFPESRIIELRYISL